MFGKQSSFLFQKAYSSPKPCMKFRISRVGEGKKIIVESLKFLSYESRRLFQHSGNYSIL
jgi:hypothetical protein